MYELKGNEKVEAYHSNVPCGKCITTRYFDNISGKEVRTDVEIQVDPVLMKSLTNKL